MKITFLGTGTSQGVPVIACDCEVCKSKDKKDIRLRSSVLVNVDGLNLVIDTGPDFRYQMLRENVQNIDAVLYTHSHKDHVAGMDDIRAFNHKWKKEIELYCSEKVSYALKSEFPYVFTKYKYPGVPSVNLNIINNSVFKVNKTEIQPILAKHYKMDVFGFRIHDFVYLTDISYISKNEKDKLKGAELIVLDALRIKPHISHLSLSQAIDLINEVKPKRALLTHISHYMGLHKEINLSLPHNIDLAYDTQQIIL